MLKSLNAPQGLIAVRLPCIDYALGLALQQKAADLVLSKAHNGIILLLEHPPTITLGKNAGTGDLKASGDTIALKGIQLVQSDRGGKVTCHNPGQLVIYPILDLRTLGLGVKNAVCFLEEALIQTLKRFGLDGSRNPAQPGVWLETQKVAAIGLRVKKHILSHGCALNVCNDLSIFNYFTPCGISALQLTSISEAKGHKIDVSTAAEIYREEFAKLCDQPLPLRGPEFLL